jgi:hypothetical protein
MVWLDERSDKRSIEVEVTCGQCDGTGKDLIVGIPSDGHLNGVCRRCHGLGLHSSVIVFNGSKEVVAAINLYNQLKKKWG